MLDINLFSEWLNLMSELYQKPISDLLEDFLYEEWSELSDLQFERGARLVMRQDQRFPTIERLIELARSTAEARRPERSPYQPDAEYQDYDPMSPEAIAARHRVREQLAQLRQARLARAESQSGLTSLADVFGAAASSRMVPVDSDDEVDGFEPLTPDPEANPLSAELWELRGLAQPGGEAA